jgi:hypothetical protein
VTDSGVNDTSVSDTGDTGVINDTGITETGDEE